MVLEEHASDNAKWLEIYALFPQLFLCMTFAMETMGIVLNF